MADISTELARILSAIYGEDVRGSIHDAIEKINDVSEVVLTTGTAVTGPSSSSTGFYDDSLYLNTDTFELWKCTGVNTWASQGILKGDPGADGADGNGIASITKTATSGLVDTYTITYTDGTTSTFTVTNGEDGANGNKWYRGTGISGKAALPTVYTGSGVADANSGDMFLNPSEGAVYSCVTGGVPTVATWQYEMTLSGGSGGTSDYPDLTNKPQINGHTLLGNQTGADLGLASSSDIPTVDQTYNATSSNAQSGTAVAEVVEQIYADNGVLGAKNLFRKPYYDGISKTSNGVTFTVNSDGSVTVDTNGSASTGEASFRLIRYDKDQDLLNMLNGKSLKKTGTSGDVIVQGYWGGDTHREDEFTVNTTSMTNWNFAIYVARGKTINNVTVYPMLRLASDPDDTYVPYAMTNRELTEEKFDRAEQRVLGAKNLLPYPYTHTTKTDSGITFTDNGDGTITADGTASADVTFYCMYRLNSLEVGKKYILSGCPSGGSDNTYRLAYTNNTDYAYKDFGEGVEITGFASTYTDRSVNIWIKSGVTVNNLVFKPMIRLASDPDDTYVPYAMTNRELTEAIANIVTDDWTTTSQVQSDGTVTFSGLNDSYGYSRPYYDLPSGDSAYTYSKVTKSGSGTSVTLTYTTDAPIGTVCKLRILK